VLKPHLIQQPCDTLLYLEDPKQTSNTLRAAWRGKSVKDASSKYSRLGSTTYIQY